jgi:hypothetical protein
MSLLLGHRLVLRRRASVLHYASELRIVGDFSSLKAGQDFTLTVWAMNDKNQVDPGFVGTITLLSPDGVLTGELEKSATQGSATFTVRFAATGTFTIEATSPGMTPASVQVTLNNAQVAVKFFDIPGLEQGVESLFIAHVVDENGAVVTDADDAVTFRVRGFWNEILHEETANAIEGVVGFLYTPTDFYNHTLDVVSGVLAPDTRAVNVIPELVIPSFVYGLSTVWTWFPEEGYVQRSSVGSGNYGIQIDRADFPGYGAEWRVWMTFNPSNSNNGTGIGLQSSLITTTGSHTRSVGNVRIGVVNGVAYINGVNSGAKALTKDAVYTFKVVDGQLTMLRRLSESEEETVFLQMTVDQTNAILNTPLALFAYNNINPTSQDKDFYLRYRRSNYKPVANFSLIRGWGRIVNVQLVTLLDSTSQGVTPIGLENTYQLGRDFREVTFVVPGNTSVRHGLWVVNDGIVGTDSNRLFDITRGAVNTAVYLRHADTGYAAINRSMAVHSGRWRYKLNDDDVVEIWKDDEGLLIYTSIFKADAYVLMLGSTSVTGAPPYTGVRYIL